MQILLERLIKHVLEELENLNMATSTIKSYAYSAYSPIKSYCARNDTKCYEPGVLNAFLASQQVRLENREISERHFRKLRRAVLMLHDLHQNGTLRYSRYHLGSKYKTSEYYDHYLKNVLAQPDTSTKAGIRDLFLMILMYDTGARVREILNLQVKDFDAESKTPCVHLIGKGNKKRIVPVMAKTVEHFRNYVLLYHPGDGPKERYLFYTVRNSILQAMSDDNVSRFIKKYGKAAKEICPEVPKNLHPHLFRHSRSIHLYRSGMPLALLSEWLGHAQLETTMIYAYADTEMKRDAIQKATGNHNPLMNNNQVPIWKGDEQIIRKLYGLK